MVWNGTLRFAIICLFVIMGVGCSQEGANTITIKRDTYGVPHVYADDVYGLYYGYGYAVAEDRLFQSEMIRRSVTGTVSEVLGMEYLQSDTRSRSVSNMESIAEQLLTLSLEDREIFKGYAAGFNTVVRAVLSDREWLLPKEFIDFGFDPVEWTELDVAMIWIGTMANRYSSGSTEVFNLATLGTLREHFGDEVGAEVFDQILWKEDPLAPTTVTRNFGDTLTSPTIDVADRLAPVSPGILVAASQLEASWRGVGDPDDLPVASNLWILGPDRTEDGSTILNNGPQFGWFNPAYTYGIGLHGAGFDVVGQTPFAYPIILFGTNGTAAWGSTAGPLDVNDYYQVRLNPANDYEYFYEGEYRRMSNRSETIYVKDADAVTIELYSTVHGTVTTFDQDNGVAYALRRSWEGFEVESLIGWVYQTKAQSWEEFLEQTGRIAITSNHYYADVSGNIGYISPGRLPIRPAGQDQRLPAVGDGSMEWLGIRPLEEIPQELNPPQGIVINWNNQSAAGHGAHGNWSVVDRVNELTARLNAKERFSRNEVWDLNRDLSFADLNARYFIPFIEEAAAELESDDPVLQAVRMLSDWNMLNTDPGSSGEYVEPAGTIMREWLPLIYERVLLDDLPTGVVSISAGYPTTQDSGASFRLRGGSKLLYNALLDDSAGVTQTFDFFNGADAADRQAILIEVLREAVDRLTAKFGSDTSTWLTPVAVHPFSDRNFLGIPSASPGATFELPTYMNRGTQNHQVIFGEEGVSMCSVAPPGQSGFVAPDGTRAQHYMDQLQLYQDFGCKRDWLTESALDENLESVVTLSIER